MNQRDFDQNNLLSGINVDRDPASQQDDTILDAVNMTFNPTDGQKFIYQAMKSTVPKTSEHQHFYDTDEDVIKMQSVPLYTTMTTNWVPLGLGNITLREAYFQFFGHPEGSDSKGKPGFKLRLRIERLSTPGTYEDLQPIDLRYLSEGDVLPIRDIYGKVLSMTEPVTKIEYLTDNFTLLGSELGSFDFFGAVPEDSFFNVGPSIIHTEVTADDDYDYEDNGKYFRIDRKAILGSASHGDVTYFIVGNPDFRSTAKTFKNNNGPTPAKMWNNTDFPEGSPEFHPDFKEDDDDILRDRVATIESEVNTYTVNSLPKKTSISFNRGGLGYHREYGHNTNFVGQVTYAGDYNFSFESLVEVFKNGKEDKQFIVCARLNVVRSGETYENYRTRQQFSLDNFSYFANKSGSFSQWDYVFEAEKINTVASGSIQVPLTGLEKGDKIYIETAVITHCKRRVKLSQTVSVNCHTSHREVVKGDDPAKMYATIGASILESNVKVVNASTNLHSNGQIMFDLGSFNTVDGEMERVALGDIASLTMPDPSTGKETLEWKKATGAQSYLVEFAYREQTTRGVAPASLSGLKWYYLDNVAGNSFKIDYRNIYSQILLEQGLTTINKDFGVWFKVTPITSGGAGNYIGGYYMITLTYEYNTSGRFSPLGHFSVYPHKPVAAAINGSSNSDNGVTSDTMPDPTTENLEYAVDYMDFHKLNPEGKGVIHGLSPGSHRLYLKFKDQGEDVYVSRDIVVGSELDFEHLELSVKIDMSGEKDITDFVVELDPKDPVNYKTHFHAYVSPYKPLSWEDIEALDDGKKLADGEIYYTNTEGVLGIGIGPGQTGKLPILQLMNKSGILYMYVVSQGSRDEVFNNGISYRTGVRIGETDKYYFRMCKAALFIDEDYKNNKYNLEIGSFPSPYYGHEKGTMLEAYQPLQNLDGGAFITDQIKLSGNNYVDMQIQPVYDGSVNIVYADGENTPRIINSGFAVKGDNKYELIQRLEDKDSNQYTSDSVESATRLVQTEKYIIKAHVKSVNSSGGNLEVGGYKFLFKLASVEGNETNFIAETGLIPIMFGDSLGSIQGGPTGAHTPKSVDIELEGVDPSFNHVNVYVEHVTGVEQEVRQLFKIDKQFSIPETSDGRVAISISGFEHFLPIDQDNLRTQKSPITAVKALGQVQNRLFIGNFTEKAIDYNKLILAAKQILVYPSKGPKETQFVDVMGAWPGETEETDLAIISDKFYKTSIQEASFPDMNSINSANAAAVNSALRVQGYHNPAFVEKYAGFWPKETYKFNVGFVTHDNLYTRPVPVSGGDYIDVVPTYSHEAFEGIPELFDTIRDNLTSNNDNDWSSAEDINFNTLGVCRFPGQIHTNDMIFPKFRIDLEAIEKVYPGFSVHFKGFFFTRERRKPDIIMQGFTGPVVAGLTDKTVIHDEDPATYVPKVTDLLPEFKVAVPALYGNLAILAYECVVPDSEGYNWSVTGLWNAGALVTNVTDTDPSTESDELGENAYNVSYVSTSSLKKSWFKSNDMFADYAQAAADFNGRPYGMEKVISVSENAIKKYETLGRILNYKVGGENYDYKPLHVLHAIKNISCSMAPNGDPATAMKADYRKLLQEDVKVITPDYRPFGTNTRSAGGFSSLIPFRAMVRTLSTRSGSEEDGTDKAHVYLTGAYTPYVGITTKDDLSPGFYNIYPSKNGPISKSALKSMYATREDNQNIAITPSYSFEEFDVNSQKYIDVYGTRGDCFATLNIHNVARSLPTVSASPSSGNPTYTAAHEGSTEPNSYRASAASMSIMATHLANNLTYARHTEVKDEKEAAAYGGPRSFLPLSGQPDRMIAVSNNHKQKETEAFNKGYADNFLGRKYYSISGSSPYYTKKGNNTVAYSGKMSMNSFYNAFRDFDLGANKNYASELGEIQRIEEFGGNLVLVHSYGVSVLGIDEQAAIDTETGQKVKFSSGEILPNKPMEISGNYGTTYPRSVRRTDNTVYGVDIEKGKIWRISGNQLEIISENIVESYLKGFTYNMRGKSEVPGERYVATFYNSVKGEVIFSIYDKDTAYPNYDLPIPAHIYYFLDNLYKTGLFYSDGSTGTAEELLYHWAEEKWVAGSSINLLLREDRLKSVNMFLKMKNEITPGMESKVNNCLTLVYYEARGTWATRWSSAPEFMFERKGKMYSVANKQDGSELPSQYSFLEQYEAAIVAEKIDKGDRLNVPVYHDYDVHRPIFWEHEGFNPAIPQYGSMYGKDPVVEMEVMFAPIITSDKTFETLSIIGSHSTPSQVMYTMSDDNKLLNMVMDKAEFAKYANWDEVEEAYFNRYGDPNTNPLLKEVANPNMFFVQQVRDRRYNSLSRANAFYENQRMEILITKNLMPLYVSKDAWSRLRMRLYQDKLLKVRLRYESGEEVKINALSATYTV